MKGNWSDNKIMELLLLILRKQFLFKLVMLMLSSAIKRLKRSTEAPTEANCNWLINRNYLGEKENIMTSVIIILSSCGQDSFIRRLSGSSTVEVSQPPLTQDQDSSGWKRWTYFDMRSSMSVRTYQLLTVLQLCEQFVYWIRTEETGNRISQSASEWRAA